VYELVTSKHLFRYERNEKYDLDETETMLYQMMLFTGEVFRAAQLQLSPKAPEYFTATCKRSLLHRCPFTNFLRPT
jgi:serine/threonine-protein kinase SRPK3